MPMFQEENADVLNKFVETVNGKDGTGSHLVTIPPGPHLSDALISSPILQSEDGSGPNIMASGGGGFEFGVDPHEDPELALALRVSMEEQRARQQAEGAPQQAAGGQAATTEETGIKNSLTLFLRLLYFLHASNSRFYGKPRL